MSDFGDRLAVFRQRFLSRAVEDASALRQALAEDDWNALRRRAHNLAGNAGLFGFADVGLDARRLEEAIDEDEGDEVVGACADTLIAKLEALPPA